LLLLVLVAGGLVFANRIMAGDAFTKEEAQHGLYGLWVYRDVQGLDWPAFWHDTQRQMIWPFLHSWILAVFFFIFGVGYVTARSLSLVIFFASLYLVYLISLKTSFKNGPRIGMIAVILGLTSPLMLRFASENMIEGFGALLFLAAAYTYTLCEEKKITLEYFILAFLISLSIFTNYIYAYIMIVAFLIVTLAKLGPILMEAMQLSRKGEKSAVRFVWWAYRKMIVLGFLLVLLGSWFSFSFSRKVLLLVQTVFKYSGGEQVVGLGQNLLYYPQAVIEYLSFSPWVGALLLVSLVVPFVTVRYHGTNRLYIYVWTALVLATVTLQAKLPQMIYIIIPFVFIIFAAVFSCLFENLLQKNKRALSFVLIIIIVPIFYSLPSAYAMFFPNIPAENMVQVLNYFEKTVPAGASMVIPFNMQRLNQEVAQFHFRERKGSLLTEPGILQSGLSTGGDYYLTVALDDGSYYQKDVSDDSLSRWNEWLLSRLMEGQVRLFSNRRFASAGLTAKIYQKTSL